MLTTFGGQLLTVTTCRVRSYVEDVGQTSLKSIMLEQVASCSLKTISNPWLLIISAVVLVTSLAAASVQSKAWVAGLVVAAAFAIVFFATRREVSVIGSAAEIINVEPSGSSPDEIHDLINTIEEAKDARYRLRVVM